MFCGSGALKTTLAKEAGVEPSEEMREQKLGSYRNQTCEKTVGLRAPLKVKMSKKCMLLWREAPVQVKMFKAHHIRTTFGRSVHHKRITLQYRNDTALQLQLQLQLQLRYTTLHYTFTTLLHCTSLRSTTLHYYNYNYSYITSH